MEKLPQITKAKQVGKNLNVIIGEETFTVTGAKEELIPVKEAIKAYQEKGTKANHAKLIKLLKPATTKAVEAKEKQESAIKAEIKKTKKKAIELPKEVKKVVKQKVNLVKELKAQIDGKDINENDLDALRKLLAQGEAIVNAKATPKAIPSQERRRGEY